MSNDLFPLVQETMQAFSPHYSPAMGQAYNEAGLQSHDWGLLFLGCGAGQGELTDGWLEQMWGYVPLERVRAELAGAAERGLIAPAGDAAYDVTEKGRQALDQGYAAAHSALSALELLPDAEMRRLAELLGRVVDAALDVPEPANKQQLVCSRRSDPGDAAAPAARIDQYLTDLSSFRDAAHLAAWQPYGLNGAAWETLTFIWREQADSLEALAKQLERRSTSSEPYRTALSTLVECGLIAETDGHYHVTEAGRALRQEAEDTTDRLSAGPWSVLSSAETGELKDLLTRLRDSLQQPTQEVAAVAASA